MQRRVVAAVSHWSTNAQIPVLAYEQADPSAFVDWVRNHRLDAVVTRDQNTPQWLRDAGFSTSQLPLLASYALDATQDAIPCGMTHHNDQIGSAAIDWLARMVEQGQTGLPPLPSRLLLPGSWKG